MTNLGRDIPMLTSSWSYGCSFGMLAHIGLGLILAAESECVSRHGLMMGDQHLGYSGLNRFDNVDATGEAAKYLEFLDRVEAIPEMVLRRH